MMTRSTPWLLLLTLASCDVRNSPDASQPRNGNTASASGSLAALEWLTGYWTGSREDVHTEELWLPRRGDVMVGVHVDLYASGRSFFEYLRIEQRGDTLVLAASPRGTASTYFTATKVGESRVSFENPEHDFPQKISYFIDSGGRLHAEVSGPGDGSEKRLEWIWERTSLPGGP